MAPCLWNLYMLRLLTQGVGIYGAGWLILRASGQNPVESRAMLYALATILYLYFAYVATAEGLREGSLDVPVNVIAGSLRRPSSD